jgi:hypothetical protein
MVSQPRRLQLDVINVDGTIIKIFVLLNGEKFMLHKGGVRSK